MAENRHRARRYGRAHTNPAALSVGAIFHIIGQPMPVSPGTGRHRVPGEDDDK